MRSRATIVPYDEEENKQGELALNGPAVTTISALSELPPSKICPAACRSQAKQLVKQMTLKEKAKLCSGSGFWTLDQIPRLNLPQIRVCDGPHGLRKDKGSSHLGLGESVRATCFPTAVALAASWDRTLLNKVGVALGKECAAHDVSVLLGPGVNIKRHPQCGRNFEYFSEDPLLSGELAAAFIQGVQENGIGTSLKHFACNEQENNRLTVDTLVDERTLREVYLPAFEIPVKKAQPWTVMCAYNRLNGPNCSENGWLLNKILRDEWGFQGSVVTDWGAVVGRVEGVQSGCDLEMPASGGCNDCRVFEAAKAGKLSEKDLDTVVTRTTELILAGATRRAIGHAVGRAVGTDAAMAADAAEQEPIALLEENNEFARECAAQCAVLLKNEGGLLPLKRTQRIALIGGFAELPRFQGSGSSRVNAYRTSTPLAAMRSALGEAGSLDYACGYDATLAEADDELIAAAVAAAAAADVAVVLAGLPNMFESEGFDRDHMRMPAQIDKLVAAVAAAQPRTVVALSNGAPVEMPWLDAVPALLETYLGGQGGALALVDILFGDRCPSGKLAETFPLRASDCPSHPFWASHPRQIVYREGLNVGYRYFCTSKAPVLFPFGFGLSYTSFEYSKLSLESAAIEPSDSLALSLDVANTGGVDGAEIVQLYVRDVASSVYRPDRELKEFAKVHLKAGERTTIKFTLPPRAFAFYDIRTHEWRVEPGQFDILVGASALDIRLSAQLTVRGETAPNAVQQPAFYETLDDEQLAALGLVVPPPDPLRPFTLRTTIGDLAEHGGCAGAAFFWILKKAMGTVEDPVEDRLRVEMVRSLPLQQFANFANGNSGYVVMPDAVLKLMLCCFSCSPGQKDEHHASTRTASFSSLNLLPRCFSSA
mmetsp:Transcript_34852/g.73316  ORF Transcript_34852/g.73316 Transcript_34852/m.73316 type:complete len:882 (+) Transcript_34852:185-2830(+)